MLCQLKANVAALKSKDPKLTEVACCAELSKDFHYLGMGANGATLRRRLQQAKKLDLKGTR